MQDNQTPNSLQAASTAMKRDWDWRARDNARWFINTYKLHQSEAEFDETGRRDFDGLVLSELSLLTGNRDPRTLRVLEIGCGIGRMSKHLAELFGEVQGVDVSGEMIVQARERLAHLDNARFDETSGFDFSLFPDESFDFILSAYVFQHVPTREIIRANIADAYRVLKPGGIFKFAVNGIADPQFDAMPKDTWTGTNFSETDIRQIARQIGAQLVSVIGGNTQYCWSYIRKRKTSMTVATRPRIAACGGAQQSTEHLLRFFNDDLYLTMLVAGLSPEQADINNLAVRIDDEAVLPCYTGAASTENLQLVDGSAEQITQINLQVPQNALGRLVQVCVEPNWGDPTEAITITLPPPQIRRPVIHLITNTFDGGLDLFDRGPKSSIRLFMHGLSQTVDLEQIVIRVGTRSLKPVTADWRPNNAAWEFSVQLPVEIQPGETEITFCVGDNCSAPSQVTIKAAS